MTTPEVIPQWTEALYPPTGGQDHLGLGSVITDRILPALSPHVIVLTVHPRYWSFYTWLLWEFWQTDRPRTKASYSKFHRPREFIYAVGASSGICPKAEHETLGGAVVGTEKAAGYGMNNDYYDTTVNYIKSPTGGYGLYYAAAIALTGLTVRTDPARGVPFDAPTPSGEKVAQAFRSSVADTEYYRDHFDKDEAEIHWEVVEGFVGRACLCQLRTETAPDRALLRDVFLYGGEPESAAAQRSTFRFLLDLASQTDGHKLDEDEYRQLIYFRDSMAEASYRPSDGTTNMARRWRMYQAREYYNYALNRIWRWVVAWGLDASHDGVYPVAIDAILQRAINELSSTHLAGYFEVFDPGLTGESGIDSWVTWLADLANNQPGALDEPWDVQAPINEHQLYWYAYDLDADDPRAVTVAFASLCLLVGRFGRPQTALEYGQDWFLFRAGDTARLAMSRFLNQMRDSDRFGATAAERLAWLLTDYVIEQHRRVATSKLPHSDTFRFQREGNRLRFLDLPHPAMMNNSRFAALSTMVHELGFVGALTSEDHTLTPAGVSLLADGEFDERPLTGDGAATETES